MTPRLVAMDGPAKGRVFSLEGVELIVGRDPSSAIVLPDASVSRQHCVIRRGGDGACVMVDLDSRNGVFIDGLPVRERRLEHGSTVRLGDCHFVFLLEPEEDDTPSVRLEASGAETRTLVELRREDSVYFGRGRLNGVIAARALQSLRTLLRMSAAIRSAEGVEGLARQVLELTLEAAPARHAAILLFETSTDEPVAAWGWDRATGPRVTVPVERELVSRAWRDGVTLQIDTTTSMVAAPIISRDTPLGVLYLDSGDPIVRFDEEHLQLAAAIGGIAGPAIENARRFDQLEAENRRLREEISIEHDMIGESPPIAAVYRLIARVAPTLSTVLIQGESGTGKELVARAIHRNSPRAGGPFVAINCAALTETLLESELFGHERGAFTGAVAQKKGRLEVAEGGTVFLDEIGELPASLQAKLLRVLQEREMERVGGTRSIRIDVRILAATNADLKRAIERGAFRSDLYFRLNVVSIDMPPLRERKEDISLLASYFVSKAGARAKRRIAGVSPAARALLIDYSWPGNVRELQNAIERAVVLGSAEYILPEDLPESILESSRAGAPAGAYHDAVKQEKKQVIVDAVRRTRGNYTEAARLLGVHPNYLHRLIRNLDLKETVRSAIAETEG